MNKLLIAFILPFILSSCSIKHKEGNKQSAANQESVNKNIDFNINNLQSNYFDYVDTSDLVNMPPIDNGLKDYLFEQISSKANQVRTVVEERDKFDNKMKSVACDDIPANLCSYNSHLYSGSYFGLRLYEKANSQELLNNSIVAAPLTMWSIKWLKNSYQNGLSVAKKCTTGDNSCLNQNATNPVEKLVAICQVKSPNDMNSCLGVMLNKPENQDFAFILGYLTGYNISFNVGNGMK